MGTVARMLRNRERQAAAASTPALFWLLATVFACSAAAIALPRQMSVVGWACFAIGWVVFVCVVDHYVHRRRRRLAEAGAPRPTRRAWAVAAYMVVCMIGPQLTHSGIALHPLVLAAAIVVILVLARAAQTIAHRRDAARRRREVDELAQRF